MKIGLFNELNIDLSKEFKIFKKVLKLGLGMLDINKVEFNVIVVDNDYIHELNKTYRGIDRPTDVITFALEDEKDFIDVEGRVLGDIYISVDKARSQAVDYGHSFTRELCFLAVHGFLHLLGYDHMELEEEEIMFSKQELILNETGITK